MKNFCCEKIFFAIYYRRMESENFGGKKFGNNRGGHETPAQSNRFSVVNRVGGNNNLQFDYNQQCDACEQSQRRKILVRTAAGNFRNRGRGDSDNFFELRLSRASSARKSPLHNKFGDVARGYALRTRSTRRAKVDTNRADKFAAVGICETDNDNLHGIGFGRARGKFKLAPRFTSDCGVRGRAVPLGLETAGLGYVVSIYGNFFRNDNSLWNPLENFIRVDDRGNCLHADFVAILERLSENANHGFPRPER